uniref:Si:dkey-26c10.5 n=1 Tax=Fundulus heteroclitus TaxID=8078 RepID=A0A3Q2QQJ8_FUNHE
MEMQEIPSEAPRSNEEEGAGEPMLEVITREEAEPDHYEKLQSPSEDFYATVPTQSTVKSSEGKKAEGSAGLYRLLCLILTVVCLILLILVLILGVKLQAGSRVCAPNDRSEDQLGPSPTCSLDECQSRFPNFPVKRPACQQCARGWLTFGRSCFFLSTTRLTWPESQKNCSASGGSLAVVTSKSVQSFLTKKGKMLYWIGLKHDNSTWNWVNDSELLQSYWTEAAQKGDCAYLNSGHPEEKNWGRASCEASAYFICQLQF